MSTSDLYLFAGGGTGGHLMPGLAVAERLSARVGPACRLLFVGTDRPLERALMAAHGHRHIALPVESTQTLRRRPWRFVSSNWHAYRQAHDLLSRERPRIVVGLGGYASLPVVWAATRRNIPTVLLEQNVIAGRANRLLGRRAGAICLAFDESRAQFRNCRRLLTTGTPVRDRISTLAFGDASPPVRDPPTLLVLGGSQGAAGLNHALLQITDDLAKRWPQALVVHQSGHEQCDSVRQSYARAGLAHVVEPFFGDLSDWYSRATLAVSRAGGTTLAELACAGCPAVLVPFPYAADDHQTQNAEWFFKRGAARLVRQMENPRQTAVELLSCLEDVVGDAAAWAVMQRHMRELARPDATDRVVEIMDQLATEAEN